MEVALLRLVRGHCALCPTCSAVSEKPLPTRPLRSGAGVPDVLGAPRQDRGDSEPLQDGVPTIRWGSEDASSSMTQSWRRGQQTELPFHIQPPAGRRLTGGSQAQGHHRSPKSWGGGAPPATGGPNKPLPSLESVAEKDPGGRRQQQPPCARGLGRRGSCRDEAEWCAEDRGGARPQELRPHGLDFPV